MNYLLATWAKRTFGRMTMATVTENDLKLVLSDVEKRICGFLNDYAAFYNQKHPASEPLELRITGGWVRDKLLGYDSHDLDIAINLMTGEQLAIQLGDYLRENYSKYKVTPNNVHKIDKNPEKSKHLETATTKLFGMEVDFVNLRSEEYTEQSRIPIVKFGTPEEDALRRDATLNALFYNIKQNKVEDFTRKGVEDLKSGILRTPLPPRQTFLDDPLRVLRLIRFASKYNFKIDDEALNEMNNSDINKAFGSKVSKERIGVEVDKILRGPNPLLGISLIQQAHIDNVVFVWNNDLGLVEFNKEHCDDWNSIDEIYQSGQLNLHIKQLVTSLPGFVNKWPALQSHWENPTSNFKKCLLLSTLLLPFSQLRIIWNAKKKTNNTMSVTEGILKDDLKIGKNESAQVAKIVDSNKQYAEMVSEFYIRRNQPGFGRSFVGNFLRMYKGDWEIAHFTSFFLQHLQNEQVDAQYEFFHKYIFEQNLQNCHELRPLINGKEMASSLGLKGGPWLGEINDRAIFWQLDNPNGTKEQLLEFIKSIIHEHV
ncbi:hypothetical protein ZYGR_0AG04940 [Zygosaccharomyces rouxii]|uniref:CCA tRNA nucleotidyltransferase, mitochondrial n=1 Tax=Zygosaccharomyces rouxii TaxID=4956 RepID=A0A1Q3AA90_ZYGRO|nr:hypothetical protein ZYGR_0AG04940 [Zygosaccharomyces rouxii]